MEDNIINLFCLVDEFCQLFLPHWEQHLLTHQISKRRRQGQMSVSEIMTIYIYLPRGQSECFFKLWIATTKQIFHRLSLHQIGVFTSSSAGKQPALEKNSPPALNLAGN